MLKRSMTRRTTPTLPVTGGVGIFLHIRKAADRPESARCLYFNNLPNFLFLMQKKAILDDISGLRRLLHVNLVTQTDGLCKSDCNDGQY